MVSGRQTLIRIDQALEETRKKTAAVESQIEALSQQLSGLRQAQAEDYKELARLRLGQLADAALIKQLDQAEQRVVALLDRRQTALDDLHAQIQAAAATLKALESERADQASRLDAAAQAVDAAEARTQARLAAETAYQAQRERAQEAERTAAHAAEKASRSDEERELKGAAYRADPLFMYLWRRGFGQPTYKPWGLTRWLDAQVARLIGYADASANYVRLNEIPERLREHAAGLEARAEAELKALRSLDETARVQDGIAELDERRTAEQTKLEALDPRIDQAEADLQTLQTRKAAFAAGTDDDTRQATEVLAAEFQGEDLLELRRQALATPFPEDDLVVARLLQREDERQRIAASLQGLRAALEQQQQRLQELEILRRDFRSSRYDRPGSSFDDHQLVAMMLGQFLEGMLDRQRLWRILEEQQRYRPEHSDPGFGSGGFGQGTVWGGGLGNPQDLVDILGKLGRMGGHRGGWGGGSGGHGGGGGGGGFRTGGSF